MVQAHEIIMLIMPNLEAINVSGLVANGHALNIRIRPEGANIYQGWSLPPQNLGTSEKLITYLGN